MPSWNFSTMPSNVKCIIAISILSNLIIFKLNSQKLQLYSYYSTYKYKILLLFIKILNIEGGILIGL